MQASCLPTGCRVSGSCALKKALLCPRTPQSALHLSRVVLCHAQHGTVTKTVTGHRRRRRTTARRPVGSEKPVEPDVHTPSSTGVSHSQQESHPAECSGAALVQANPTLPAVADAAAAGGNAAGAQPDEEPLSPPTTPRPPRRIRRPTSPSKQQEPPHICYNLSSAVGSYTDPNSCSVHLDEEEQAGSHENGTSSTGSSTSSPGGSHNGTCSSNGLSMDRQDADTVKGLVYGATVRFSDSAALRLRRRAMVVWEERGPRRVLIVKKPVPAAATTLREMADWLHGRGLQVFVEKSVHASEFPDLQPFDPATTQVDFAITLGGDGTVLHLASLFAEDTPLPPVMCFAMGTLGFLTPFDAGTFRSCLARVLAANRRPLFCTLRTRKRCAVLDASGKVLRVHHILNECVVDRGAFPSSVYLELYIDGSFVTAAEADGLIIATPSGSTAYSMSAGGSMVAPSVPCTLITPLSPHSLSFRPLIIPENADLMVRLPENARSHARASFDGKHPMRIARGSSVHYSTSLCPLPLINIGSLDVDWYEGITRKLKWNQSIRGVPSGGLEAAILQQAAAAAASSSSSSRPELHPQLSLGGLVSDLSAAAHNEAKVANWVEEALLEDVACG